MKMLLATLSLLILTVSCTNEPTPGQPVVAAFFDLDGYMSAEIERLTERRVRADKSITLNGVTEKQTDIVVNYANDLRLFREADINKPAWVEKYRSEEETLSGSHRMVTYTARDSSLVVQRLLVEEDQGATVKVEIERKTGTVLSDGVHQLVYQPATGYSVRTRQTNRFGDDVDAVIDVRWRR